MANKLDQMDYYDPHEQEVKKFTRAVVILTILIVIVTIEMIHFILA
jgi:hypothetical protein